MNGWQGVSQASFASGFRKHQLKEALPKSFKVMFGLVQSSSFRTTKPHLDAAVPLAEVWGIQCLEFKYLLLKN